jgi:hypothetical protein
MGFASLHPSYAAPRLSGWATWVLTEAFPPVSRPFRLVQYWKTSLSRTRPKPLIFGFIVVHALRLCPSLLASLLLASLLPRVRAR